MWSLLPLLLLLLILPLLLLLLLLIGTVCRCWRLVPSALVSVSYYCWRRCWRRWSCHFRRTHASRRVAVYVHTLVAIDVIDTSEIRWSDTRHAVITISSRLSRFLFLGDINTSERTTLVGRKPRSSTHLAVHLMWNQGWEEIVAG